MNLFKSTPIIEIMQGMTFEEDEILYIIKFVLTRRNPKRPFSGLTIQTLRNYIENLFKEKMRMEEEISKETCDYCGESTEKYIVIQIPIYKNDFPDKKFVAYAKKCEDCQEY